MDLKFKVGDIVQSDPNGSDVQVMGATWHGIILEVVGENDEGGCYTVLGGWKPFGPFNEEGSEWTTRQLWGSHLEFGPATGEEVDRFIEAMGRELGW